MSVVNLTGDKRISEMPDFKNAQGSLNRTLSALTSRAGFAAGSLSETNIFTAEKNLDEGRLDWTVRVPTYSESGLSGECVIKASNHKGNVEKKDFTPEELKVMEGLFYNTSDDILGFTPKVTSRQIDELEISAEKKLILQKALTPRTIIKSAYYVRPSEPNSSLIADGDPNAISKAEAVLQNTPKGIKVSTKAEALAVATQFLKDNLITDYNPGKTTVKSSQDMGAKKHDNPLFWNVTVYRSNEPVGTTTGRQIMLRTDGTVESFVNCTEWDEEITDTAKKISTAPLSLLSPEQITVRQRMIPGQSQINKIAGFNLHWQRTASPDMKRAWASGSSDSTETAEPCNLTSSAVIGTKFTWNPPQNRAGYLTPISPPVLPAPTGGHDPKDPKGQFMLKMFASDPGRGLNATNGYAYLEVQGLIPGQYYLVSGKTDLTEDLGNQWEMLTPAFRATASTKTFLASTPGTQMNYMAWNASLYNGPDLRVTTNSGPVSGEWTLKYMVNDLAPVRVDITVDGNLVAKNSSGPYSQAIDTPNFNCQPWANIRNIGVSAYSSFLTIPAGAYDEDGYYYYGNGRPLEMVTQKFFDTEFVNPSWINDFDEFVAPGAESRLTVSLTEPGSIIREIQDESGNILASITNSTTNTYWWGDPLPLNWSVPAGLSGASFQSILGWFGKKKLPRIYLDGGTRAQNGLGGNIFTVWANADPMCMVNRTVGMSLNTLLTNTAVDNLHLISLPWNMQNGNSSQLGNFRWSIPTDFDGPHGFRFPLYYRNSPFQIGGDRAGPDGSMTGFTTTLSRRATAGVVIFAHGDTTELMTDTYLNWRTTGINSDQVEIALRGMYCTTNTTGTVNYSCGPDRLRDTYLVTCEGIAKGSDWPISFGTPKGWDQTVNKCMKSIIVGYAKKFPVGPDSGESANAFFATWEMISFGGITPHCTASDAFLTAKSVHSGFNGKYGFGIHGYGYLTFPSQYDVPF